ncbi:ABC transporter permease [Alkalicoccus halolimnae]|uniref:ABC transporter permease n=1 Tax=Alkalicoccus halolimnae TaxID=1667239 RepID=A0A5C7FKN9_9BACI|nr:ABC transporter permease [Alkalicoccus halolimnae]TXF85385.1 ABC transporter permease [Alkalicoccus halolimnae]
MKAAAVIFRILRQFRRDKRSLALMLFAPILVITLMWLVLDTEDYEPEIAVVEAPKEFLDELENKEASITSMDSREAIRALEAGETDGALGWENSQLSLVLEGSDSTANRAVIQLLQETLHEMNPIQEEASPEILYLHGSEDLNVFDNVGPVLVGFFVFFFVFLVGGISFLRERIQGTLERSLVSPLRRWEIIAGYLGGFGIFAVLQSIIIVSYSIYVLDMFMAGSFRHVLLITLLLALAALSLGTLLSTYAGNEFQMIQFIPLVIVPQVFFSGIFNLETMDPVLRAIGKIMPLTYGAEALRGVMIRGEGPADHWMQIAVLAGFSLLFITLNILALKKHRRL